MKRNQVRVRMVSLVLSVVLGMVFLAGCTPKVVEEPESSEPSATEPKDTGFYNPLTGEKDYPEKATNKRPVAIMVNNIAQARPQAGLCTPDIVVEALVEGGETRMMWLYANKDSIPERVGSVRSARHDFVELSTGFDAIFVHWGGSTGAYNSISNLGVDDIDGQKSAAYFFRDTDSGKALEHTGFSSGKKIRKGISALKLRETVKEQNKKPFSFGKAPRALGGEPCKKAYIPFSGGNAHTFEYSADDGKYYNSMNGVAMTQEGGKQMAVENVIVLFTSITPMEGGLVDIGLESGTGIYINGGASEKIKWEKGGANAPFKLTYTSGEAVTLNVGKSWIGLVPSAMQNATTLS